MPDAELNPLLSLPMNLTPTSAAPKKVAIVQSNYIPWKGYFDLIDSVDEFVLFDTVQFTRRDWRNRNKIKTKDGLQWLTIPVKVKGSFTQSIDETLVSSSAWADEHFTAIRHAYARAAAFQDSIDWLHDLYMGTIGLSRLSDINHRFIQAVCQKLAISTKLSSARDFTLVEGKNERLIQICLDAGATEYVSGPLAKDYLDGSLFLAHGLKLTYFSYNGYREYSQLFPPFEHGVTILDVILNAGNSAYGYIKKATP